ncbi:MAG: EF-hand domain-containing protein [Paracoccaceae bacterium]
MTRLAILMTTACLFALPGHAQSGARAEAMFERLDADADGSITLAELTAHKTALFTAADANADGLLDEAERTAMRDAARQRAAADGVPFDTDGDGNLSLAEFTGSAPLFDRADADADDIITRAEFDAIVGKAP